MAEEEKFEELEGGLNENAGESNAADETASFEVVDESSSAEEPIEEVEIVEDTPPLQKPLQKRGSISNRLSKSGVTNVTTKKRSMIMPIMTIASLLLAGLTGFLYWEYTKKQARLQEQLQTNPLKDKGTSDIKEPKFDENDEKMLSEADGLRYEEQKLCFKVKNAAENQFATKEEAKEHIKSAEDTLSVLAKAKEKYNTLLSKSPYDKLMEIRNNLINISEDEGFLQGRILKANLYINGAGDNSGSKRSDGGSEQGKVAEPINEQAKQLEEKTPEPVSDEGKPQEKIEQPDEQKDSQGEKQQAVVEQKSGQDVSGESKQSAETDKQPIAEDAPKQQEDKTSNGGLPKKVEDNNEPKVADEKQSSDESGPIAKGEEKPSNEGAGNKQDTAEPKVDNSGPPQLGEGKMAEPISRQDSEQGVDKTDKAEDKQPMVDEKSKENVAPQDENKSNQGENPSETAEKKIQDSTDSKVDITATLLKEADDSVIGASELFKEISSKLDNPPTNQDELRMLVRRTNDTIALLIKASECYRKVRVEHTEEKYKFIDADVIKLDKIKKYLTIVSAKLTSLVSSGSQSGEK